MENLKLMLEEQNIQHAIIGDVTTSLSETLLGMSKSKLSALATANKIAGRSKLKKEELALALQQWLTEPANLESILLEAAFDEWDLFKSLVQNSIQQDNYIPYGQYVYLLERGVVYTYFNDKKLYLVMPDEIVQAFHKMNTAAFNEAYEKRMYIFQYVLALNNLYGIFTTEMLHEIYNDQHEEKLSLEEITSYMDEFLKREQYFVAHDGYIVNQALLVSEDEKEYKELVQKIQNKPHYVPDQATLLQYADDMYFEMTPQLKALDKYLSVELCTDSEMREYLIDDIQLACSNESTLQEIVYEFERRDIQFHNKDQAEQIIALIADVYNHTRFWSNCGYTPIEMSKIPGNFRTGATPFAIPNKKPITVEKIGRNDPCPCGSGKKYKKCCGKN
ncbi:SEC-C metal-binding domain-containing protein [Paenibacillus turicensis]|uniref:YecA family protein n=1 Tax=Paenibacillus turicensis TaxID=160487 RepID=UPI003D2C5352